MASKKARTNYILLPDKHWVIRASQILMVSASMALLVMSKTGNPAIQNFRSHIDDLVTPVLSVAASPMDAMHNAGAWVGDIANIREENARLRNENIELLKWQAQAKTMQTENQSLRTLLNVVPAQKNTFITARIVSDLGGPYVHSALINGGSLNGIKKDEAAISDNGLMGRVVEAGESSARVLLLNDINSRVPVIAERTHEKSILIGTNSDMPNLSYLAAESKIKVGDRIITSGDGGIFPEGVPVGVVSSVTSSGIKVQPYVNPAFVQYVSVIDYSF